MSLETGGLIQSGAKPDAAIAEVLMSGGAFGDADNDPDDAKIIKAVMGMLGKAKAWKATWSVNHERWWNLWESNHYRGKVVKTISQAVVNIVWSSIETFVAHIADHLGDPIARARTENSTDQAEYATKWLRYETDATNLEEEIQHPVRAAAITGCGWLKIGWNWKKFDGKGDVEVQAVDEKFVFCSPYARTLLEALYIIEARNVPREYVLRTWEKGHLVPPGTMDTSLQNIRKYADPKSEDAVPAAALVTTTTGSESRWTASSATGGDKRGDLVTLIEAWIRQEDGTMRLVVIANNVLLQDGPSPFDDEDFPYVVFNIIPTLDTIQGRGLIQFMEGLQDILNLTMSNLLDQQKFAADPMLGASSLNLEDAQQIENSPGSILPDTQLSTTGSPGYYWLQAPGFNAAWLQIQQIVADYMDSVLGRVDVLKGEHPPGVNTLGGLAIVRDEANIRVRALVRWVRASVRRTYKLMLSRLRQFVKDERQFRILGRLGQEEFVKVNETTGYGLEGQPEQSMTLSENVEFDIDLDPDVAGGRQAEVELAMTLAGLPAEDGMPMVDRQFVLEKVLQDEAPEVLQRMGQMQAMMAQQQAAAGPGGEGTAAANPAGAPKEQDPIEAIQSLFMGAA